MTSMDLLFSIPLVCTGVHMDMNAQFCLQQKIVICVLYPVTKEINKVIYLLKHSARLCEYKYL